MNRFILLLALIALAALPVRAGVAVSVHIGGGYGGYHGYSGGGYGGHGYYGCASNGYHGYYGGIYGAYPSYGYAAYGYAPIYNSYPDYGSSAVYTTSDTPVYSYAPPSAPAVTPAPTAATGPTLATGKLDEFGFIHSPYTTATFKADKVAPGQVFYDPITGQAFTVAKPEPPPTGTPSGSAPSTLLPVGKLDEFGYVHSPFSTFTFKVPSGNYAQVFRDPFTGQSFTVRPNETSQAAVPSVAGPAGVAQVTD